jgi:hypothetical protein
VSPPRRGLGRHPVPHSDVFSRHLSAGCPFHSRPGVPRGPACAVSERTDEEGSRGTTHWLNYLCQNSREGHTVPQPRSFRATPKSSRFRGFRLVNSGATASFSKGSTAGVELVDRAANPHSRKWKRAHGPQRAATAVTTPSPAHPDCGLWTKGETSAWPQAPVTTVPGPSLSTAIPVPVARLLFQGLGRVRNGLANGHALCKPRGAGCEWGEMNYPGSCKSTATSRTAVEAPSPRRPRAEPRRALPPFLTVVWAANCPRPNELRNQAIGYRRPRNLHDPELTRPLPPSGREHNLLPRLRQSPLTSRRTPARSPPTTS